MLAITKHIEYLLTEHDCVLIPGLGGFVLQDRPARFSTEENIFYPPTRSIVFNPTLTYNDGLLAASFMRAQHISYEQASQCIEQEIATLHALLQKAGNRVAFGNLGCFLLTGDNTLTFEPSPDYLLNLNHFGLPTLSLLPVKELTSSRNVASEKAETRIETEERVIHFTIRRRVFNRVMAAAALLLLLLVTSVPFATAPEADQASLTPATLTDEVNNRVAEGEYLIVVSTLTDRESALLQLQKFHNNGVTEPIYLFEDGRRAYLYTHSFTQRKEAYVYLQKQLAGETPFPDAWVMRAGKSTTASPVVK